MLLYNTGARVSELAGLQIQDVSLGIARCRFTFDGKGRKNRSVPLWRQTAKLLRAWLRQLDGAPDSPLLPNARGNPNDPLWHRTAFEGTRCNGRHPNIRRCGRCESHLT